MFTQSIVTAHLKVYNRRSFCLNSAGAAPIPLSLGFAWWLFDDNHLQIEHGWESNPGFNIGLFTRISFCLSFLFITHTHHPQFSLQLFLKLTWNESFSLLLQNILKICIWVDSANSCGEVYPARVIVSDTSLKHYEKSENWSHLPQSINTARFAILVA